MARLIPKQKLEDITNSVEQEVAKLLVDQLPEEVTIFHSQPWLAPARDEIRDSNFLDQGEADFIILHPKYGILDLEVKGGLIEYACEERNFYRKLRGGRRKKIRDPFAQGQKNLHRIKDSIVEKSFKNEGNILFVHGYAAIFPDCIYDGDLPPGGEDPRIVLDKRHLAELGKQVIATFRAWDRRSNHTKGKSQPLDVIEKIRSGLLPEFRLRPSLQRSMDRDESELVRLTKDQSKLLEFLDEHPRALIKGVAGSGKTMLAMDKATSFAEAGYRTLFLCYNDLLAEILRDQVPAELKSNLSVRHFHAWCRECCVKPIAKNNGITFNVPQDRAERKKFWDITSANLLLKAIPLVSERYDAVVVDEGQDFASDWWYPIEEALDQSRADRALYIFYDPDQNLYGRDLQFPIEGKPYPLKENCRNTKKISNFCRVVAKTGQSHESKAPEGELPSIVYANSNHDQLNAIQKILDQLLKNEGLKLSQIAVLVAGGITDFSGFKGIKNIGKHLLTDSINDWKSEQGVLLESSKRFKGLESDVVIIAGMPEPGSSEFFTESDLYVSASRAKHRLYLICKSSGAQKYSLEVVEKSKKEPESENNLIDVALS
jgi:hypothetical protein